MQNQQNSSFDELVLQTAQRQTALREAQRQNIPSVTEKDRIFLCKKFFNAIKVNDEINDVNRRLSAVSNAIEVNIYRRLSMNKLDYFKNGFYVERTLMRSIKDNITNNNEPVVNEPNFKNVNESAPVVNEPIENVNESAPVENEQLDKSSSSEIESDTENTNNEKRRISDNYINKSKRTKKSI
jgi:hypothetical protein